MFVVKLVFVQQWYNNSYGMAHAIFNIVFMLLINLNLII